MRVVSDAMLTPLSNEWTLRKNDIVGQEFENSLGLTFVVTGYFYNRLKNSKKLSVRFLETGYETYAGRHAVNSGAITDKLDPRVAGVGCLGEVSMGNHKRIYYIWSAILNRCYNPSENSYQRYGAKGITVCDRWLRFEYFLEDFTQVDGYDEEQFEAGKLALDKDVKQIDLPHSDRVYSLETCMFIPRGVNSQYTEPEHKGKSIIAINVDTGTKESFKSMSQFARQHGLNRQSIAKAMRAKKEYKGWIIKEEL